MFGVYVFSIIFLLIKDEPKSETEYGYGKYTVTFINIAIINVNNN